MRNIILTLLIPFICNAQEPKEILNHSEILLEKFTEKDHFTKNELLIITTLNEITHSDQLISITQNEKLSEASLTIVSSSIATTYALIAIKTLKLNKSETEIFKSFINRSGSYLAKNVDRHKSNEKIQKAHSPAYELLVKATENLNYKVDESQSLLKRFKKSKSITNGYL